MKRKRSIRLEAPAKLNLFLEVLGKRPDGYHEIRSIFHAINLCDDVSLEERKEGIHVTCSDPAIPTDEGNLAWRAADLMRKTAGTLSGVAIRLKKRIPVSAGLGGGSSDAAAVIKGLNDLWRLGLSDKELMRLAAQIGSDCAFFIKGGTAVCEGRGEIVKPIPLRASLDFVLVCPPLSVPTAQVYRNLTRKDLTGPRRSDRLLRKALKRRDIACIGRELFNRLESPAFELFKELRVAKERLLAAGPCGAVMTGSGSTLFGTLDGAEVGKVVRRLAPLGLGRVLSVQSWNAEQASRVKGGGRREHHRSPGAVAADTERPSKGLCQHHV